jgi:hypothetical protein
VSVCTRLTRSRLTKSVDFSATFAVSGQKLLDASHEFCSRQFKNLRKFEDRGKRGTVFATLQQAYVLGVVPTLKGEGFLCEMTLLPQVTEGPRKCSLFRRTLFVSAWHRQTGVCGVSTNTSTKYSIHSRRGGSDRHSVELCRTEAA